MMKQKDAVNLLGLGTRERTRGSARKDEKGGEEDQEEKVIMVWKISC